MATTTHPARPNETPEGYRWEAVEEGPEWRVVHLRWKWPLCRTKGCRDGAAAELNRGRRSPQGQGRVDSWWAYCPEHMYGRWVEDGRVMGWRLVPLEEQRG